RFDLSSADGTFQIRCRRRLGADYALVARGRMLEAARGSVDQGTPWDGPPGGSGSIAREERHRLAHALGLDYGPAFQCGLSCVVTGPNAIQAALDQAPAFDDDAAYSLHPARLDACFQGLID